jgi:hypothetical protein
VTFIGFVFICPYGPVNLKCPLLAGAFLLGVYHFRQEDWLTGNCGSLSGICCRALGRAFHDKRQRDPPDDLSGRVLDIDGKVAPIPLRHFVLHDVGESFLGLLLGRCKALQFHPLTVGREGLAIMDVEEKVGHGCSGA